MKEHNYYTDYLITEDGEVINKRTKRTLKSTINQSGYEVVGVQDPENLSWKSRKVHRLVAETYISNPDNLPEVNHKDCNKVNNTLSNLEWVTSKQNKAHAWGQGLYTSVGEGHWLATLSDSQVHGICLKMEQGWRNVDLAREYDVSKDVIANIRGGSNWSHISKDYAITVKKVVRKSPATVLSVAELLSKATPVRDIANLTGLSRREINRIKSRSTHKELTKHYNF